ncbi:MAG: GAF domain-containing sensor histidine kinase [Candidatus Promineifilaceae bacterium]|jgi:signal transduction histidine kinase
MMEQEVISLEGLQQQLEEQARKISALHAILEAIGTPADLPIVLMKSLRAALAAAQGDAGFIHIRDKSGKIMRLAAREAIPESTVGTIETVSSGDGLVAWVTRNNKALLIPNISEDSKTVYLAAIGELKVYVGVPISRGQRVWGTLSVLGKDPEQFGKEELALLVSVGEEIGIVVENARLRRQAERILVIQERNRLARELHDSVTQSLYSVTLFAEAGRRTAKAEKHDETAEYFTQIGETAQQALKEMRLLIHKLRPSILAKEGLVRALQQRLNSVEGRAGVRGHLLVEGEMKLSPPLEAALFQIAQEALNNTLKHAMATEVFVRLDNTDSEEIVLEIEDNGRGFDAETALESDGIGIVSMQERAESFDGSVTILSTPGRGSVVKARLRHLEISSVQQSKFDVEDLL